MNDDKETWEQKMSTGKYFGCKSEYVKDILERRNNKDLLDASLSAIGVTSGIHQGSFRKGFFDIRKEGQDWKVLEIGCGYGLYAAHFTDFVKEYIGVDVSETIVNVGNKSMEEAEIKNVKLCAVKDCDVSFIPDNSIDFVFTAAVFIHTPWEVTRKYLEETYNKLKPGGKFLHHFNMHSLNEGIHRHMWQVYSEGELASIFKDIPLKQLDKFDNKPYAENQYMRYIYGEK